MAKQMVITIDVETGALVSVADEQGNPAKTRKDPQVGSDMGQVIDDKSVTEMKMLRTKINPNCFWFYNNGVWYQICSG